MLREAVGDPALHGRQPVPLEQPQQAGRGVVVKTAEVPEVPGNLAITVPGTAVAPIVTVIADVALIAKVMIVAAVTLSGGVTGVAGVDGPSSVWWPVFIVLRLACPRRAVRSACFYSTRSLRGGVVHRQDAISAARAEIA